MFCRQKWTSDSWKIWRETLRSLNHTSFDRLQWACMSQKLHCIFALGVDAILQIVSSLLRSRWNRWNRVKERVDMPICTICLLCRVSACLLKLQTAPLCVSLQCVFHSSVCVTNCTSCCVSAALSLHWHTPAHLSPPIQTLSCCVSSC